MTMKIGYKAGRDNSFLAGGLRGAMVAVSLGIMALAPMGCTMTVSMCRPTSEVAQTKPAVKTQASPITRPKGEDRTDAQAKADAKAPAYLPDHLLDEAPAQETLYARSGGRAINVLGEFNGKVSGKHFGNPALQQVTFPESGYDTEPAVNPATKAVVFSSTRNGDHAQLYMQRPGSAAVTQLTDTPAESAQPSFSLDGAKLAFCSNRSGNWHLYMMDANGRHLTRITDGPSQDMHPSFNGDGNKLAYCSLTPASDQWQIWTIDIATGQKKMIGNGLFPSWSPQPGVNRIAFQKTRAKGSRWFSVWTIDLVDDEPANLTEVAASPTAALVGPVWSYDGKRMAFSAIAEPGAVQNGKPKGEQDVWVSMADGSERVRLTDGNGANLSPFWAADRRVYFVSDRGGNEAIWSLPVRSTGQPAPTETAAVKESVRTGKPETGKPTGSPAVTTDPSELEK